MKANRILVTIAGTTVMLVALIALSSSALSHPWTFSGLQYWEQGTSSYGARARLVSSSAYDYHGLIVQVRQNDSNGPLVGSRSSSCGEVDEGCGTVAHSPSVYFPQSSHFVSTRICAFDGSHALHPRDNSYGHTGGVCHGHNVDYNSIQLQ